MSDWMETSDGKGMWAMCQGLRCVVKEDDRGYWWGVYEDAEDESYLVDEGTEQDEAAARDAAEDAAQSA